MANKSTTSDDEKTAHQQCIDANLSRRFWAKVDQRGSDECWPWIGGKDSRGYGGIWRNQHRVQAHRVSWEIANGRPPRDGMVIMHSCDNPPCCNPAHLSEGTRRDNGADMVRKGRNDSRKGVLHHRTHLTENDVREIRSLHARGVRRKTIASDYRISLGAVADILDRRNWAEVQP